MALELSFHENFHACYNKTITPKSWYTRQWECTKPTYLQLVRAQSWINFYLHWKIQFDPRGVLEFEPDNHGWFKLPGKIVTQMGVEMKKNSLVTKAMLG